MQSPHSFVIGPVAGLVLLVTISGSSLAQALMQDAEVLVRDQLIESNTRFALDLYGQLRGEKGNLLISPHSVSTALAMTWAGAEGETKDQMARVLQFTLPRWDTHLAYQEMLEELQAIGETESGPELHIANRLWGDRQMEFREPYLRTMRAHYQGGVERVDFANTAELARRRINTWIENQTEHRIVELLRSSDLSPSTMLVLTNAIYFKGVWHTRFEEDDTRDGEFYIMPDRTVTVPMMEQVEDLGYFQNNRVQVVEMPYETGRFSMVLLVPLQCDGLPILEEELSTDRLAEWIGGLEAQTVSVIMPRFRLARHHHLEQTLSRMGMPLAFTPGQADLSGISGNPGHLWIDLVIHQTFIEVDESGTEASGATAVVLKRGGDGPPIIRADHPFLFLIRDRQTDAILFLGRCSDPS